MAAVFPKKKKKKTTIMQQFESSSHYLGNMKVNYFQSLSKTYYGTAAWHCRGVSGPVGQYDDACGDRRSPVIRD
jgi:hypothetical protein